MTNNSQNNLLETTISKAILLWETYGKTYQKGLIIFVKWTIMILSGWYLYVHVIKNTRFNDILALSATILHNPASVWLLSLCLGLVIVNWSLEAFKWKFLLKKFTSISFFRSLAAIFCGSSIGIWAPNRMGEYVGRVFFLDPGIRIKGMFATIIGSLSQLVVTLMFGTVGFVYYERNMDAPAYIQWASGIGGLIFMALLLFFYFNIKVIRSWLPIKPWTVSLRKYLVIYKLYKTPELEKVLIYSVFRYIVFTSQFYILMVFFGVQIPILNAMLLIFLMYGIQTISPTNGFTELVVRGGATVFLFHSYTTNLTAILAASYGLWLINLMIPALAGACILGFVRINKRLKFI